MIQMLVFVSEISKALDMYMFLFDDILLLTKVKKQPRKVRIAMFYYICRVISNTKPKCLMIHLLYYRFLSALNSPKLRQAYLA